MRSQLINTFKRSEVVLHLVTANSKWMDDHGGRPTDEEPSQSRGETQPKDTQKIIATVRNASAVIVIGMYMFYGVAVSKKC